MLIYKTTRDETLTWTQLKKKMAEKFVLVTPNYLAELLTQDQGGGSKTKVDRVIALLEMNPIIGFTVEGYVVLSTRPVVQQEIAKLGYTWIANSWIATHTADKVVITLDLTTDVVIGTEIANTIQAFCVAVTADITTIKSINVKHADIVTTTDRTNLWFVDNNLIEIPYPNEATALQAINLAPADTLTNAIVGVDSEDRTHTGQIIFTDKFRVDWDSITTVPSPTAN